MQITLPTQWQHFIEEKVRSGDFPNADEVIQEALRLLQELETADQARLEELRCMVAVGLDQSERGQVAPFDPAATLSRLRQK